MAEYQDILGRSKLVRDENDVAVNTAMRVGGVLVDLCEYIRQVSNSISNSDNDNEGTVDLTKYSWWGRSFSSGANAIIGGIHVTDIFFSQDGATNEKKLKLDSNGDLYFDGNFYATGGITALGQTSGGGSSGDGTLSNALTIYNSNGVGWNFNGSSPLGLKFGDGLSASVSNDIITVSATGGSGGTSSGIQCYLNGLSVGTFSKMYFSGNVEVSKNSNDSDMVNVKVTGGSSSSGGSASNHYMLFFYGSKTAGGTAGLVDGYDGSSSKYLKFIGSGVKTYQGTTNNSDDTTIVEITGGSSGSSTVDLSDYLKKSDAASMYLGKSATAAAASKLATVRSIWGQTFDGTGNVSGNMAGVGNISMNGMINVTNSTTSGTLMSMSYNNKSMFGFNSNKDLFIGYGYYQDVDAHITLYGSKTLINTYDGSKNRYFWFRDNYLSIPDDGELRIGNGKLIWDDTNKAFRMTSANGGNCNFYCDGGISALGVQSTSASSVDFAFKNLTVNSKFYIGNTDKYLEASGSDIDLFMDDGGTFYFDNGQETFGLESDGSVYVNNLNVDGEVNMAGVSHLQIEGNSNSFVMTFVYNGKTYTFEPSDSQVSIK